MGVGVTKSPQPFHLKNGAPSHADFRRIKQGGLPGTASLSMLNIIL